jgi:AraC-like DNA-binding protein
MMEADIFNTQSVPPKDQYDAWRQRFWPILDITSSQPVYDGFPAANQVWQLGGLAISRVSAPPVVVARRKAHFRRDHVDHWVLACCRSGETRMRMGTGAADVPAGLPFLWSMGMEFESKRTRADRVQLYMPRDVFRDVSPLLDAAAGTSLDTALGRLLGDYILTLERHLPALAPEDLPRLTQGVLGMVAACIAPSADRIAAAGHQIELGRRERVRQAIRKHLRSPALGPAMLCRLVGISRSNIYRLLDDEGGIFKYIQRQRLLEAHMALCDSADRRPISALAEDLCFPDASAFSRAFRREFGRSPRDVRYAAEISLAVSTIPRVRPVAGAVRFDEFLRLR